MPADFNENDDTFAGLARNPNMKSFLETPGYCLKRQALSIAKKHPENIKPLIFRLKCEYQGFFSYFFLTYSLPHKRKNPSLG